jgi:hypothetical protein
LNNSWFIFLKYCSSMNVMSINQEQNKRELDLSWTDIAFYDKTEEMLFVFWCMVAIKNLENIEASGPKWLYRFIPSKWGPPYQCLCLTRTCICRFSRVKRVSFSHVPVIFGSRKKAWGLGLWFGWDFWLSDWIMVCVEIVCPWLTGSCQSEKRVLVLFSRWEAWEFRARQKR